MKIRKGSKYVVMTMVVLGCSTFVMKTLRQPCPWPVQFWKQNDCKNMGLPTSHDHNIDTKLIIPQDAHKDNVTKVTHIGFLKVHKAGSTTMQNLFFRFGIKYKLNILLPRRGNYFSSIHTTVPKLRKGEYYDVLAIHTVFNKKTWSKVLHADSAYIGIVRDPLDRMVSAAYYYRDVFRIKYLRRVPPGNFIRSIINQPDMYNNAVFSQTRNTMGLDFGFPRTLQRNDSVKIRQLLSARKKEFLLVLVMEKFDESLILMKRYLKWSMADILYLKTNSHQHKEFNLTKQEKATFRSTCFMDYAIYNEFSRELDRKISAEDESFEMEVGAFRRVLSDLTDFCKTENEAATMSVERSPWNEHFSISLEDCKFMKTHELSFIRRIRNEYYG